MTIWWKKLTNGKKYDAMWQNISHYCFLVRKLLMPSVKYLKEDPIPSATSGQIQHAFLLLRRWQLPLILPTIVSTQFPCTALSGGTIHKFQDVRKPLGLHTFLIEWNWLSCRYSWSGSFSWVAPFSFMFPLLLISLRSMSSFGKPILNVKRDYLKVSAIYFWSTPNSYESVAGHYARLILHLRSCALIFLHMSYTWPYCFTPVLIIAPSCHGHFPLLAIVSYNINSHHSYFIIKVMVPKHNIFKPWRAPLNKCFSLTWNQKSSRATFKPRHSKMVIRTISWTESKEKSYCPYLQ